MTRKTNFVATPLLSRRTHLKAAASGALAVVFGDVSFGDGRADEFSAPTSMETNMTQTAAQKLMGDVAPKLAELTDTVLFGDVWERAGLSKRDRSLITVSALLALNRPDQLKAHLAIALTNGVTKEELTEVITHLAFYAGWPCGVAAVGIAREVFNAP
jgi:4-carboxymuconolactone decarboxylase